MLCYYLACSFCKIDLNLEVISFTELLFCVQCSVRGQEKERYMQSRMGWGGLGGWGSLEPRTSDWVLILVEGFLEKLKLVLVLVELFGLLVQQLCTTAHFVGFKTISKAPWTPFCRIKLCTKDQRWVEVPLFLTIQFAIRNRHGAKMPKDYTRSPVDCRMMSNSGMVKDLLQ